MTSSARVPRVLVWLIAVMAAGEAGLQAADWAVLRSRLLMLLWGLGAIGLFGIAWLIEGFKEPGAE